MELPALAGVTVLDCSNGLAGAYCTKLLADAGADVVTVEPPGGVSLRASEALFGFLHTSKRSVVVDRSTSHGVEALERLIAGADIVVEEGDPIALAGLATHPLLAIHPGLV